MALWVVRAGKVGDGEEIALREGLAIFDRPTVPDLRTFDSRQDLETYFWSVEPLARPGRVTAQVAQLWTFGHRMAPGDMVAMPSRSRGAIAVGKITGNYEYRPDLAEYAHHTRPVTWIAPSIPRDAFDQDLRWSLGALLTVFGVSRNHAEERIEAILAEYGE